MEPNVKTQLDKYNKGATGPNRAGLFTRVAPGFVSGKFGGGSLFSKILRQLADRQENI